MEEKNYSFLMIDYDTPFFIKQIQDKIPHDELYLEDDNLDKFGLEKHSHVTLVACMDNDLDYKKLLPLMDELPYYGVILTNVSVFETEKFDVLKCDVACENLFKTNRKITSKFDTHSEHKEYHPHMTIAYMKPGMGKKYTQDTLDRYVFLMPKCFHFSNVQENGKYKHFRFE